LAKDSQSGGEDALASVGRVFVGGERFEHVQIMRHWGCKCQGKYEHVQISRMLFCKLCRINYLYWKNGLQTRAGLKLS
jgi:hypothetical protein